MARKNQLEERLRSLKEHLQEENPILVDVMGAFQELDRVGRRLGLLGKEESNALRVPWWPLISVLGVYSSGKSTFVNEYLQYKLQATGSQAVDNKFTVICFSKEDRVRLLPGLALDADPRFPLYKITKAIEEASPGEGSRVDAYLQLKTCPSDKLRAKIVIDSPGFDADAQRTATLRITTHILDISDLVLVFFDARHPEAGSMHDTLESLIKGTIHRTDSNKFLYILNLIDVTAREDNPEEVFAAWQRALAQYGLTAGRCYTVFSQEAAPPIQEEAIRTRLENKRAIDLAEIHDRIEQVKVERSYRIVGMLEQQARTLERTLVPTLRNFLETWRRQVIGADLAILVAVLAAFLGFTVWRGYWQGLRLAIPHLDQLLTFPWPGWGLVGIAVFLAGYIHFRIRKWMAGRVSRKLLAGIQDRDLNANFSRAFQKNTRWWRSVLRREPAGWGRSSISRLQKIVNAANGFVQKLNDAYANPSGKETAVAVPQLDVSNEKQPG